MKKLFYILACLIHRFKWCILAAVLTAVAVLMCGFTAVDTTDDTTNDTTEQETVVFVKAEVDPKRAYFDVPLSEEVQDHIFTECEKHNISPAIVVAMIERESNYDTYCIGDDGRAAGLCQVQAKWHIERMVALNCTDLFNPQENITVAVDYLAELIERYGSIDKALTAYNRGSYSGTVTEYAKDVLAKAERLVTNGN